MIEYATGAVLPEYEELFLERLRVVARQSLSAQMVEELELRTMMEAVLDRLIVEIRTTVLAHKIVDKHHRLIVDYPATPWDHWKERWLPKLGRWGEWYLSRHPVRYHSEVASVDLTEYATFPESTLAYPKQLGRVVFQQHSSIGDEYKRERRIVAVAEDVVRGLAEACADDMTLLYGPLAIAADSEAGLRATWWLELARRVQEERQ